MSTCQSIALLRVVIYKKYSTQRVVLRWTLALDFALSLTQSFVYYNSCIAPIANLGLCIISTNYNYVLLFPNVVPVVNDEYIDTLYNRLHPSQSVSSQSEWTLHYCLLVYIIVNLKKRCSQTLCCTIDRVIAACMHVFEVWASVLWGSYHTIRYSTVYYSVYGLGFSAQQYHLKTSLKFPLQQYGSIG